MRPPASTGACSASVQGVGLSPTSGGPPSRRGRERRAYQLVLAGSAAGVVAIVGFILAAVDVIGFGIPFIAAIIAVVCGLLFRRTVS
jgi:hypothetical protein